MAESALNNYVASNSGATISAVKGGEAANNSGDIFDIANNALATEQESRNYFTKGRDDFRWAETVLPEDSPTGKLVIYINHDKFRSHPGTGPNYQQEILIGEALHLLKIYDPKKAERLYQTAINDPKVSNWLKESYDFESSRENNPETRPFDEYVKTSRLDQIIGGYFLGGKDSPIPTMQTWNVDDLSYSPEFKKELNSLGTDLNIFEKLPETRNLSPESALREYEYGGDGLFGAFMPSRREILSPEQQLVQGYESTRRGPAAVIETIPAQYGEPETGFEYTPIVRGVKSALNSIGEAFSDPEQAFESAKTVAPQALAGINQYMSDQYQAGALGGTTYNPETGQVTEFNPVDVAMTLAPGGFLTRAAVTPGSTVLGMVGSKNARHTPKQLEAIKQLDARGWDTEQLFLHGTSDEINQLSIVNTQKRDSGWIGKGGYSTPEPRISGFYSNMATPTVRAADGGWASPNTFPLITKKGNYRQYSLMDKGEMGILSQINPNYSQKITDQNIAEGFIGADVRDIEGNIIERVNYFPDADTRSALDYSIPETPVTNPSALDYGSPISPQTDVRVIETATPRSELRQIVSPSEIGFDPSYENRVGESRKISGAEFRYGNVSDAPPEVSIFDFEGRPFVTTMSDRTRAGASLSGIGDVDFDMPVELLGGQGYMFGNPGELWAAAQGPASSIMKTGDMASALGGISGANPLYIPYRMGATGSDFSHMTTDTMLTYARNSMTKKAMRQADKQIKSVLPGWKGIENPESMIQLSNIPDSQRKVVRNLLDKNFRDQGGIGIGMARLAISDPEQYRAITGGIQNIGEFELGGGIVPSSHRSYPYAIPGQGLGTLKEKDINVYELMPALAEYRGIDVTKPIPQSEMYTLQTGIKGAPGQIDPSGTARPFSGIITEDILREIERRRSPQAE